MKNKNHDRREPKRAVVSACLFAAFGVATALGQDVSTNADDKGKCKDVKASGTTVLVTADCRSPVGLCAAGAFAGNELIRGTTFATILGTAPSLGLPGLEPSSTLSISGERTITTSEGSLSLRFITAFDTARGEAAEINRVTGGTGKFEGATGTLFVTATGTTSFALQLTGRICTTRP